MKRAFLLLLVSALGSNAFAQSNALSQKAAQIMQKAFIMPEQAFPKAKTLYIREERTIDSAGEKSVVIKETYYDGVKFRFTSLKDENGLPADTHIIYDGNTYSVISDVIANQTRMVTPEEARSLRNAAINDSKDINRMVLQVKPANVTYDYLGTHMVRGKDCFAVKSIPKPNFKKRTVFSNIFYIDKKTGLVMKYENLGAANRVYTVIKTQTVAEKEIPAEILITSDEEFKSVSRYTVKINEPVNAKMFLAGLLKPGAKTAAAVRKPVPAQKPAPKKEAPAQIEQTRSPKVTETKQNVAETLKPAIPKPEEVIEEKALTEPESRPEEVQKPQAVKTKTTELVNYDYFESSEDIVETFTSYMEMINNSPDRFYDKDGNLTEEGHEKMEELQKIIEWQQQRLNRINEEKIQLQSEPVVDDYEKFEKTINYYEDPLSPAS